MLIMTLIQQGADVNAENRGGWGPLHAASEHNAVETVEVLLKHGADVNFNYGLPLWDAVERNAVAMSEVLLRHGADVNAKDTRDRTPIDRAAHETAVPLRRYMLSPSGGKSE